MNFFIDRYLCILTLYLYEKIYIYILKITKKSLFTDTLGEFKMSQFLLQWSRMNILLNTNLHTKDIMDKELKHSFFTSNFFQQWPHAPPSFLCCKITNEKYLSQQNIIPKTWQMPCIDKYKNNLRFWMHFGKEWPLSPP